MKIIILVLFLLIALGSCSFGQNVNIPDANFKAYLVGNSGINTNLDEEIQVSEANAYSESITCPALVINDLTGIEAFTNITTFSYDENNLTTIDLSQNTALLSISLIYSYNLVALNVSGNTALHTLNISYSPLISTLNISQNLNLMSLFTVDNTSLSALDVSQNTLLTQLDCRGCNISNLDVSQNTELQYLNCQQNNLSSLDVTQNPYLSHFTCFENNINALDLSHNPLLTNFQCFNNDLTVLNLKNISTTSLTQFSATSNPNLTCIDVDDVAAATASWYNIDSQVGYSLNCQVDLVNSIIVEGQSGTSSINIPGGTLQMIAHVLPTYADDSSYMWNVTNGTGSASIDANGLLTALSDGNVTVIATANDGSGVIGSSIISISNQTVDVQHEVDNTSIELYPNPFQSDLNIISNDKIEKIMVTNIAGQVVRTIIAPFKTIDLSELPGGLYQIQITTESAYIYRAIIKE
jgi:hypothetical protein